jgi:hypothetical protein
MLAQGGIISILGVLLGVSFIVFMLFFVNRLLKDSTQDILVKFILTVFTSMVGLYIVDKLVAFKIDLLPEEQNNELFDLIKTLILMIFSYYFGTKSENKN